MLRNNFSFIKLPILIIVSLGLLTASNIILPNSATISTTLPIITLNTLVTLVSAFCPSSEFLKNTVNAPKANPIAAITAPMGVAINANAPPVNALNPLVAELSPGIAVSIEFV